MSNFLVDRRGVSSLEYGLLAGALGLVLVAVLRAPAAGIMDVLNHVMAAMHGHMHH